MADEEYYDVEEGVMPAEEAAPESGVWTFLLLLSAVCIIAGIILCVMELGDFYGVSAGLFPGK